MTRTVRHTALRRLKDTYRSKSGLLLPHIERHVMRTMTGARPDDHSEKYMHPSDMVKGDWCGRHDYYRLVGTPASKVTVANPSFRMNNVFAEGHAIHGKWQTWLWEMGVLVGFFRCKECGHRWYAKSPVECQFCRSERLEYKEYPLHHERYMVEGHADGAVHLPEFRSLIEIKSVGLGTLAFEAPRLHQRYLDGQSAEEIWRDITHPFSSHMRQGQLYLWMAWPAYEQIVFIYESKFHQQTKEFVVDYNKKFIASILDTAHEVSQCVRTGHVPERPEWATGPDGKVCPSCPYRATCWSIDDEQRESAPSPTPKVRRAKPSVRKRALRDAAVRRT